ncbi:methyltransferase [Brachybacterium sp. GPGPB12]|uniref:N5-glutamine methyltransferase family protein n=1 Tax=Brachybacterium sp. GPGPB12 TaxID=3023517 RepID=UPI0031345AE9
MDAGGQGTTATRSRASGGVFAEEEAEVARAAARDADELEAMTRRREAGEFLEQVVEEVEVMGERLVVAPGVFVPRQRTALLIGEAVREARARRAPRVLEMCAGAAPVAALVARGVPGARVHVADVDDAALAVARQNLPAEAVLHLGDGWAALPPGERFDVIAAVPPYVPRDRLALMPREAREHEPPAALLGGEDGLDHVRTLLAGAADRLARGGVVAPGSRTAGSAAPRPRSPAPPAGSARWTRCSARTTAPPCSRVRDPAGDLIRIQQPTD